MRENGIMGIVFSDIHDDMLAGLTEKRTTASVPFGGRYRFIDFTLSNLVRAGVSDVGLVTKSNYQSLVDHVGNGKAWDLDRKRGGLSLLSPYHQAGSGIYRGRIEALSGVLSFIRHSPAKYVIISDSDTIINLNLRDYVDRHISSGADVTLLYKNKTIPEEWNRECTSLTIDNKGRVTELNRGGAPGDCLYLDMAIMERDMLEHYVDNLTRQGRYSFTRDFIQANLDRLTVQAVPVDCASFKICSLKCYYKASMALLNPAIRREIFQYGQPVYTKVRDEVAARYGLNAVAKNSLIADGAVIEGEVENSIVFRGVKIGRGTKVKNCILMQDTVIGENANLDYVITDKNVLIRDGRALMGFETYPVYISKGNAV